MRARVLRELLVGEVDRVLFGDADSLERCELLRLDRLLLLHPLLVPRLPLAQVRSRLGIPGMDASDFTTDLLGGQGSLCPMLMPLPSYHDEDQNPSKSSSEYTENHLHTRAGTDSDKQIDQSFSE